MITNQKVLWQYCKDEPNDNIADSESFKFKVNIRRSTTTAIISKNSGISVPLKYSKIVQELLKCYKLIVKLALF